MGILGGDEGHALRMEAVYAPSESSALSLSCILGLFERIFDNNPVWGIRSD